MPVISAAAYPQLMSAVTDSEKIVYLCGAGASMSLGAHQLSWTKWLLAGKEYLTAAEQTELEQKIGRWTTSELIDAATYLLAGLKAAGNYQNFMDQTIASVHPVLNFSESSLISFSDISECSRRTPKKLYTLPHDADE